MTRAIPRVLTVRAGDLHEVIEVLRVPRVRHDAVTGTGADGRRERTRLEDLRELQRDVRAVDDARVAGLLALIAHEHVIRGAGGGVRIAHEKLLIVVDQANLGESADASVRNSRDGFRVLEARELVHRELLEQRAHARSRHHEVRVAATGTNGDLLRLDGDLGEKRRETSHLIETVGGKRSPLGDRTSGDGRLHHLGDDLTVDFGSDFVRECIDHLALYVDAVHRLHVLGELRRPVGGELTGLGFDGALDETERNRRIDSVAIIGIAESVDVELRRTSTGLAPEIGILSLTRVSSDAVIPLAGSRAGIGVPVGGQLVTLGVSLPCDSVVRSIAREGVARVTRIRRSVADFEVSLLAVAVDRTVRESVADRAVERLNADEIVGDKVRHDTAEHRDYHVREIVIAVIRLADSTGRVRNRGLTGHETVGVSLAGNAVAAEHSVVRDAGFVEHTLHLVEVAGVLENLRESGDHFLSSFF